MGNEQTGKLKRVRTGSQIAWRLDWTFKGRAESRGHSAIFPKLDPVLQQIDAPEGAAFDVLFTFKTGNIDRIWLADQTIAEKEQQRLAANEAAAGRPFAQPDNWKPPALKPHFHNPYNFIPTPDGQPSSNNGLGHRAPVGHHAYHPGHYSGRIGVKLTVVTPLIVCDAARGRRNGHGHLTVDVLTDRKEPVIPITSFKGVLRSAYEAITCSRMGVFRGHNEKLGRRMAAGEGLAMVPARIGDDGTSVEFWMGTATPHNSNEWDKARPEMGNNNRWRIPGGTMYAAWLPAYDRYAPPNAHGPNPDPHRCRYPDGPPDKREPKHGDPVVCWLRKVAKGAIFSYWRVEEIRHGHDTSKLSANAPETLRGGGHAYVDGVKPIKAIGYVCRTGQNFSRKHDERVFFVPAPGQNFTVTAPFVDASLHPPFDAIAKNWSRLVADYREVAEDTRKRREKNGTPPQAYLGKDPGKTAFSRHIYEDDATNLRPGSLCYALVGRDGKVKDLYPVMIARELADYPPEEALPANVRPARTIDELSPADRVFGWVNQDGGAKRNRNMVRGQLRIDSLKFEGHPANAPITKFDGEGLPLAILSTPKPQQARFYLAADRAGTPQANARSADETFYKGKAEAKSLRGRKVFPHHRHTTAAAGYWDGRAAIANPAAPVTHNDKTYYREFVRQRVPGEPTKWRDDQNRSIKGWIERDSTFTATIDVINLASAELGALLWLLNLPDGHYLRMGFGKPLGFGSVRVELTSVDLADGEAIRADYDSLYEKPKSACSAETAPAASQVEAVQLQPLYASVTESVASHGPVGAFKRDLSALFRGKLKFDDIAVVKAFLAAAKGFEDERPVHYPRASHHQPVTPPVPPHPEGKNYEWFVENVAQENKKDNKPEGPRLALPPLWDEIGLPYLYHKE
ncbi:TIGR03986 family type III CRISPR-associated RAMP protein [Blastochloris sulfoviridis]|uniref:TIGR03986 family CRISPR-associated RAMP protein n=1 Tax=Blastochloris sulfoviridis TaxID=50712 RepID=A0A5M6HQR5_9HYPH|nr:TIGR03986 family CRISPR-associated RAMP protein [Blastochloris sulfoviridis]KAA5598214.1 TIGR03986 family CRISPR-associated RAMP protein [Blastochloris sulfoviridis]